MEEEKLYSLAQLESLSGGDDVFVNKMVDMFLELTPQTIAVLQESFNEDALETLGGAAHKIKPTIDMMGIESIKQSIRDLEQYGKNRSHLELIPGLVSEVCETLGKVVEQLRNR
jgi:HPt (histidine-containing phosphotransfer) domain-containing protein